MKNEESGLHRSISCRNNRRIIPANHTRSLSGAEEKNIVADDTGKPLVRRVVGSPAASFPRHAKPRHGISSLIRSFITAISAPTVRWLGIPAGNFQLATSLGRRVTGTLFGQRRGHVTFAVQDDPRSAPVLLLELATSTSALVKEMSSGLVRIALECEKSSTRPGGVAAAERGRQSKLFNEPMWTMYCNGRRCGYALSRTCGETDRHVLGTVQSVSVGAGVIPTADDAGGGKGSGSEGGEFLYMRARFERVVGSRDSEAFYMMNPDGNGGPELSIFLLRV